MISLYKSRAYLNDLQESIKTTVNIKTLEGSSVLVTGATGTVGSFLVDTLMEYNKNGAGISVYAAGRNIQKLEGRFAAVKTDRLIYAEYDMMEPVGFMFKADYIIHAAGNAYPAAFNSDPTGTIVGNIGSTYRLLEYAKVCGARRFLYISSGEVYGQGDLELDSFDETYGGYVDPVSPRSCYPNSKRAAETLCASYYSQYGLETVIARLCHTYGPGMTEMDNRAHAQFIRDGMRKKNIVMKSAGTQIRSYCYIVDCASAIFTVLINGKTKEAYNIANSSARCSIAEFAQAVALNAGCSVVFEHPTEMDIANMTPISKQVLNTEKLESLGWKGKHGVEDGVSHTMRILTEAGWEREIKNL